MGASSKASASAKAAPSRAYIALGSNLGNKVAQLEAAAAQLAALPETRLMAYSGIYRTPPWGKFDQDWFANAVIALDTRLSPLSLLEACLAIEATMGRERKERWGPRRIDLDLLSHGEARLATERLTLPHPAIAERAFVLVPLFEIAPDFVLAGRKIEALIAALDVSGISKIADFAGKSRDLP